ncbi:MAG: DUF4097 domain-containing protein [Lachnospiraceae bacterium]|nr:DUF4097 domain-containing protein [Lachnospiraceae bacterium]
MKSFYKNSFTVAVCSILLGIVLVLVGGLAGGTGLFLRMIDSGDFSIDGNDILIWDDDWNDVWDWDWDDDTTVLEFTYPMEEYNIENLDLQIGASTCEIRYDEDSSAYVVKVQTSAKSWEGVQTDVKNDTLCVECSSDFKLLSKKRWANKIVITIPEKKVYDKVTLSIGAGNAEIEHTLQAREFSVEIGAGNIQAENLVAEKRMECEVGAGNLEIEEIKAGNLKMKCEAGRLVGDSVHVSGNVNINCDAGLVELELEEKESSFDYDLSCSVGRITIGDDSHSGLAFSKTIDNKADRELKVECNVGSVIVDFE